MVGNTEAVEGKRSLPPPRFRIGFMGLTLYSSGCRLVIQVCVLLSAVIASAEVVQLGDVTARPEAYHLRSVQLQGIATRVQALPPTFNAKFGALCFGAYTFTLSDETGSIVVEVPSVCGRSQEAIGLIVDDQQVSVEARIEAPGYYTGQGIDPPGEFKQTSRAVAVRVQPILTDR